MSEITVNQPDVSGDRSSEVELSTEQKEDRKAFLEAKLEDSKNRIKNIQKELKELN